MANPNEPERVTAPTAASRHRPGRSQGPPQPPFRGIEEWPPGQGYYVGGIGAESETQAEDSDYGREFDDSYGPGDTFDGQELGLPRPIDRTVTSRMTRYGGRTRRRPRSS